MRKLLVFSLLLMMIACSKPQVSVMSFNIRYDNRNDKENWWEYRKDEVAQHILNNSPDFLGIQEGLDHQVEFLNIQLKEYQFIGVGRDDGKTEGEYSAIFFRVTRFELIKQETFWLSETPDIISTGWDAALPRIATYGHFEDQLTGKQIHVINTHFDHRGATAREESAKLILQKIKELGLEDKNFILMGDLNATSSEKPIQTLSRELDDGKMNTSIFKGPEGTFTGFERDLNATKRIDYIFSQNLTIKKYHHLDTKRSNGLWISDHHAVFADYYFD